MKPVYWALLTALTWGCVPIIEKLGLAKIPVLPGLFCRSIGVVIGAAILFMFKFGEIKQVFSSGHHHWIFLVVGGILASIVGQFFFYNSLRTGEASRVVPIGAAYPLVSFILGLIFLSEKFTMMKAGGVVAILIGIFLLK